MARSKSRNPKDTSLDDGKSSSVTSSEEDNKDKDNNNEVINVDTSPLDQASIPKKSPKVGLSEFAKSLYDIPPLPRHRRKKRGTKPRKTSGNCPIEIQRRSNFNPIFWDRLKKCNLTSEIPDETVHETLVEVILSGIMDTYDQEQDQVERYREPLEDYFKYLEVDNQQEFRDVYDDLFDSKTEGITAEQRKICAKLKRPITSFIKKLGAVLNHWLFAPYHITADTEF